MSGSRDRKSAALIALTILSSAMALFGGYEYWQGHILAQQRSALQMDKDSIQQSVTELQKQLASTQSEVEKLKKAKTDLKDMSQIQDMATTLSNKTNHPVDMNNVANPVTDVRKEQASSVNRAELMCNDANDNELQPGSALTAMPIIYTERVDCLSFKNHVKSTVDFDTWKGVALEKFQEIRQIPPPTELEAKPVNVTKSLTVNGTKSQINITRYTMNAFDGDTVVFYELRPKNVLELLPAVLVIPGSGDQGVADTLNAAESKWRPNFYQKGIANKIAQEGYIVFAIENRGFGERGISATDQQCPNQKDPFCAGRVFYQHLENLGYDPNGLQIADTLQLLNYVRGLDYVDRENIGVVGLSLGSYVAMSVSALNPDIKSTVLASGVVSIAHSNGTDQGARLLKYLDQPDLASAIAPRPLYISYGKQEHSIFGYEAQTLYSANLVRQAYVLFGSEDKLTVVVHKEGHTYDVPSVLKFLHKTLDNSGENN